MIASNKYAAAVVDVDLNIGIGWIGKAFDMVHKFDIAAAAATWITVWSLCYLVNLLLFIRAVWFGARDVMIILK